MEVKKNTLYSYTTKNGKIANEYKVGQTRDVDVEGYIRNQGTHRREKAIDIRIMGELPDSITDKKIHKQLENMGCIKVINDGTEWFKCKPEDIETAYSVITKGFRQYEYNLREEQKEAVNKAVTWFKKKGKGSRFLLSAKMRFGKCFTGVHIARELKAKRTIIVTFKTNVKDNWLKYPNQHKDFEGWEGITSLKDKIHPSLAGGYDILNSEKNIVLFVSLQDLDRNKKRHEAIFKTKWDLLIFDEIHYGGDATKDKDNFDITEEPNKTEVELEKIKLNFKYRVDMSGTPFRFRSRHKLNSKQVFTYTYLDEQRLKKTGVNRRDYAHLPDLKLFTSDLLKEEAVRQREQKSTSYKDWSLNEMFSIETKGSQKSFKHDAYVNDFLNDLISKASIKKSMNVERSVYGDLGEKKCNFSDKRHAIWWINGTDQARLLEEKLKNHTFFSKYKIINICGNNRGIEEKDFNNMLSDNSEHKGSITITQRRLLTGSTLPRIDSILVLNDCKSPETYLQAIFRVQSPFMDNGKILKKEAYVFDFSVERLFKIIENFANAMSKKNKRTRDEFINNLIDTSHLRQVSFLEGELQLDEPKLEDILEHYRSKNLAKRFNSKKGLVQSDWLRKIDNNPYLLQIISNIRGYRVIDSDNNKETKINKKKNRQKKKGHGNAQIEDPRLETLLEGGVRLSVALADFMYMTGVREIDISQIIKHKSHEQEFFKDVVGISLEDFKLIFNSKNGVYKEDELNEKIWGFKKHEDSSVKTEQFILDFIHQDKKKPS